MNDQDKNEVKQIANDVWSNNFLYTCIGLVFFIHPLLFFVGLFAYVIIRGVYKGFTQDLGIPKDETITYYIPKDKRSFPDWMY